MELHNKFRKQVTSPIDNETINVIEQLPPLESKEILQANRRSVLLNETSSSISASEKTNDSKSQKLNRSLSRKSSIRFKSKENVFKKLKSKLKEKLDFI